MITLLFFLLKFSKMSAKIFLDANATTRIDPRVLEAMLPELSSLPSNPSSIHFYGREAKNRLQKSRDTIAAFLKVEPHEILFTSSGTEAMNLLLRGMVPGGAKGHAITSNVEHSCVYETLLDLENKGLETTYLSAGPCGAVTPAQVKEAIRPHTRFISMIAVNNETGVKNDIDAMAHIALEAGIPLLVDGVAWLGKELFTIHPGIFGMGFSSHKIHGPQGCGFAFVRSSLKLTPLLTGGKQEGSLRAGTENLPGIVGLAKAVEILSIELPEATKRMAMLRDRLEAGLLAKADPVLINGTGPRICNTSNLSFPGRRGEDLLIALDMMGIAASHGSACSSGALEPSRILTNMGIPFPLAASAIRFSLSRNTTLEEIDQAIEIIATLSNRFKK
jgi:cysteine desulfurase